MPWSGKPLVRAAACLVFILAQSAGGDQRAAQTVKPPGQAEAVRTDRDGDPLPAEAVARMGSGRLRHGTSCDLAFSPDGKWLASGGRGKLRIWDATTGKLRQRFDADASWAFAFTFSADGVAVAGYNSNTRILTARVVDPASGKVSKQAEIAGRPVAVAGVAFAPGGKRLAASHDKAVHVYDPATGQETLRISGRANAIAFAPDGKSIAVSDYTDTVRIHDASEGKSIRELRHAGDKVGNVVFSPDGRFLASLPANQDKTLAEASIWDLAGGTERHRLKMTPGFPAGITCAAFSPDGKLVATGSIHPDLIFWDMGTGKEARRCAGAGYFTAVVFSPDGQTVATVSASNGAIRLWDVSTGRPRPGPADPFIIWVRDLHFGAGGNRLLGQVFGANARYIAWDATTGRQVQRFPEIPDTIWWQDALSPDESLLARADGEGTIRLWDTATGKEARTLKGHAQWVWTMVFSSDGRRLFSSATDGTIRAWDVARGRELLRLTGPGDRTLHLAASLDGRWLASASGEPGPAGGYEVFLWDLRAGREKTRFTMPGGNGAVQLAFSPDSRLLTAAGGSDRRAGPLPVMVWDVSRGKEWRSFDGGTAGVWSVAFSPDGRTLATGGSDGTLTLWELVSGRRRHLFQGHENEIHSLAFSPDGRLLVAASTEAPVYVWDVAGVLRPGPPPAVSELERCWADLAGADAAEAFRAMRRYAGAPGPALAFLRDRLKPAQPADPQRVRRLLADLDSPTFAVREQAVTDLVGLADRAVPSLQKALADGPALEVRRRLQHILGRLETGTPETLRATRAVEALEWMGTPEATRLVAELATGAPGARLTEEAKGALGRVGRRAP
jgi:WD40 repeat protein